MPHPLYMELIEKSVFKQEKEYEIYSTDMESLMAMGDHIFYGDFLSKSLPLKIRDGAYNWDLFANI